LEWKIWNFNFFWQISSLLLLSFFLLYFSSGIVMHAYFLKTITSVSILMKSSINRCRFIVQKIPHFLFLLYITTSYKVLSVPIPRPRHKSFDVHCNTRTIFFYTILSMYTTHFTKTPIDDQLTPRNMIISDRLNHWSWRSLIS